MTGIAMRQKFISRIEVRSRKADAVFVFGDNLQRRGLGGQAKEMRGEPNAIGIPTKWYPGRNKQAFFSDSDFKNVKSSIDSAFTTIRDSLLSGYDAVFPEDGIDTGLAELQIHAPKIFAYINDRIADIFAEFGESP